MVQSVSLYDWAEKTLFYKIAVPRLDDFFMTR